MRGIPGIRLTALALAIACLGAAVALVAEPTPTSAWAVARGAGKAPPQPATIFAADKRGGDRATAAEPSVVKVAATSAPQAQPSPAVATGDAESGDLSHPAALLLAAIAAVGFVGSRLPD